MLQKVFHRGMELCPVWYQYGLPHWAEDAELKVNKGQRQGRNERQHKRERRCRRHRKCRRKRRCR